MQHTTKAVWCGHVTHPTNASPLLILPRHPLPRPSPRPSPASPPAAHVLALASTFCCCHQSPSVGIVLLNIRQPILHTVNLLHHTVTGSQQGLKHLRPCDTPLATLACGDAQRCGSISGGVRPSVGQAARRHTLVWELLLEQLSRNQIERMSETAEPRIKLLSHQGLGTRVTRSLWRARSIAHVMSQLDLGRIQGCFVFTHAHARHRDQAHRVEAVDNNNIP